MARRTEYHQLVCAEGVNRIKNQKTVYVENSYFAKVHVELFGKDGIYRPGSKLAGIEGTREMYHAAGANPPKNDAATTTGGLLDVELVLEGMGGGAIVAHRERTVDAAEGSQGTGK